MIQGDQSLPKVDKQSIVNCFLCLFNNNATTQMRRSVNQLLLDYESNPIDLLTNLLVIFEQSNNDGLKLQAIVYFCNVLKRNWQTRRYNKAHSEFETLKKNIRNKVLQYICLKDRRYLKTLFNITKFIVEKDYPHSFPTFSQFVHKMIEEINLDEVSVIIFKQLKEIFYDVGERKGNISKKLFEQNLRGIMNLLCELSIKLKQAIISASNENSLSPAVIKLSKYIDQCILYIMRVAPSDFMDESFSREVVQFLLSKLQQLLSAHNKGTKSTKTLLQKNIKSLIYDFGLLELSKPLIICWILQDFFNVLVYVLQNFQIFIKNDSTRYALIGLRRIVKEFSYYSEDTAFMSSIKSKSTSANCLELRRMCSRFYHETITPSTIEQLLNFLLFNPFNRSSKEHSYFDIEDGTGVDRGKQKELGMEACVILLIEGLLERFSSQTHALISTLIYSSLQSNWTNLDKISISNLLSVIAILPGTCKKNEFHRLENIPVLQILQFIYNNSSFKIKFASIVSGWIDAFTNQQLNSLNGVLLDFIQNEGQGDDIEEEALDLLMNCCQCLNKIVIQRTSAIDLRALVQRVLPVSLGIFQNIDNPEILWPMITLISNIIVKVQFDAQLIVNSVDPSKLSLLIGNQSPMLVEALCEMFKSFLCVIPRNMPAKSVYELVCYFLNNHLSEFTSVNHQKIFHLWYITIREYSPMQGCQSLYVDLFQNHFRKNLFRKTATLVYILEEYMLSSLIPNSIDSFIALAVECYIEAEDLQRDEREKLKIAALSFQITLITKFQLQQVNSDKLLHLILQDLTNFDLQVVTPTIRNSILSIINRYVILHQQAFFNFLNTINVSLPNFFEVYLKSMEFLTSNTATKINAIALLTIINNIDQNIIIPQLHFILRLVIPEVEKYFGTLQSGGMINFIGKVDNSPSLRFASNTLSQRKEEVRRMDSFDEIDIGLTFRTQISSFLSKSNISVLDVANAFNDSTWAERFLKLL